MFDLLKFIGEKSKFFENKFFIYKKHISLYFLSFYVNTCTMLIKKQIKCNGPLVYQNYSTNFLIDHTFFSFYWNWPSLTAATTIVQWPTTDAMIPSIYKSISPLNSSKACLYKVKNRPAYNRTELPHPATVHISSATHKCCGVELMICFVHKFFLKFLWYSI